MITNDEKLPNGELKGQLSLFQPPAQGIQGLVGQCPGGPIGVEPRVLDDSEFAHDCPRAYTLVTVRTQDDDVIWDSRLIAIYLNKEDAVARILDNTFDLYEAGYYKYALVEAIRLNTLYAAHNEEAIQWFKWEGDEETGGYQPCTCPAEYEMTIGWGF